MVGVFLGGPIGSGLFGFCAIWIVLQVMMSDWKNDVNIEFEMLILVLVPMLMLMLCFVYQSFRFLHSFGGLLFIWFWSFVIPRCHDSELGLNVQLICCSLLICCLLFVCIVVFVWMITVIESMNSLSHITIALFVHIYVCMRMHMRVIGRFGRWQMPKDWFGYIPQEVRDSTNDTGVN